MKINVKSGLIEGITQIPSDNCNARPLNSTIRLIVIHNISLPAGEFGGPYISQLFTNQLQKDSHPDFADIYQLKVSAHLLIRRDAEVIQYVPFHRRAWHAGVSDLSRCRADLELVDEGLDEVHLLLKVASALAGTGVQQKADVHLPLLAR